MLRTTTVVECDVCKAQAPAHDCLGFTNREMTALSLARDAGWRRVHTDTGLADLCPTCPAPQPESRAA